MKKFLALALVVVICITSVCLAASAGDSRVAVSSAEGKAGEQITINVTLSGNPGIAYLKLKVGFDSSVMKLVKAKNTGELEGTFTTSRNTEVNPYVLQWSGAGNTNGEGVIATLTFQIVDTAVAGSSAIELLFEESYDEEFNDVQFEATSGIVTVTCGHANKTEVPAKASDCATHGNNLYYICSDCNKVLKADGVTESTVEAEMLPLADHTGGSATCEKQAVCDVCSQPYGELAAHSFREIPANDSDCVNHGNNLYYVCTVCDQAFKADKVTKTTAEAEKLPLGDHVGGTATCENKAVCTVCAQPYGELAAHTFREIPAKDSDCVNHGNNLYYVCTVCDQAFKADKVTKTTAEAEKLPLGDHVGGKATCEKQATCSVCNKPYGELADHTLEEVAAKESTCVTQGNNKYYACSVCGQAYKADKVTETTAEKEKLPLGEHIGGQATCEELAICSVCKHPYGKLAAHTMKKTDAKAQTHTEDGNIAYYTCTACEKHYADEAGTKQITLADTVIPADGHTYDAYDKDESGHWKICSCGDQAQKSDHTFGEWETTKDSTEEQLGIKERVCSVCGFKETDEIPLKPHSVEKVAAKEATHTDDGNIEYYICVGCGKLFEDKEATKEIQIADTVIPAIGHTYGEYVMDESGHWKNCSCGVKSETEQHTFGQWETVTEATKLATGLRKRVCTVCGYEELEELPILPCKHENAELVGQKDATCTAVGYTGDLYCAECEKTIAKGENIAKLPHTFEDGMCTVCGADQSSPSTGDTTIVPAVMLMMLSGAVLMYLIALKKKRVA